MAESSLPSLTVAVLAYNEEATLEAAVRQVHDALAEEGLDFEVLVVDDGSVDGTGAIADALATDLDRVRVLRHEHNLGPGSGIRTGIAASTKEVFTFFAADMQGNFAERVPHLARLKREADLLVGQRSGTSGAGPWRRLTSVVFVRSMRALFGLPLDDFNFFYFFTRRVLDAVEPRSQSAFICPEIMVRALDQGFRVLPVAGRVRPRQAGRATVGRVEHVAKVVLEMLGLYLELEGRRAVGLARAVGLPVPGAF